MGTTTHAAPSQGVLGPAQVDEVSVLPRVHPLEELPPAEIKQLLRSAAPALGSVSFGEPNRGSLFNAAQMPADERWETVAPERAWATEETVDFLRCAIEAFHEQYPDSAKVVVGDLSAERGGHLRRHRSHQSGRDADIGYIYNNGAKWYTRVTAENLDRERTWAFVKALISEADVEYIFIAGYIQALLREYAEKVEHDRAWLDEVFQSAGRKHTLIRNTWGHATHMHVRFYNNIAAKTASFTYQHRRLLR